ncbi:MAG: CIA30 family protein [Verrucomicrobiota bacterium]
MINPKSAAVKVSSIAIACLMSVTVACKPQPDATPVEATDPSEELFLAGADDRSTWSAWEIEDDSVMGGVSRGRFEVNESGNAVFSGRVSLENDGGFSSIQSYFEPIVITGYKFAEILLKGDGKQYQFRVETDRTEKHSYIHNFATSGDWETIIVPLTSMKPRFRGEDLDLPDYPAKRLGHVRFMISNGKAEEFRLEVARVVLRKISSE